MQSVIKYITFILFILLISCKEQTFQEEKVLSDILPQIIDSLEIECYAVIPPPPPIPLFDNDSNLIGIDSLSTKLMNAEYENYVRHLDSLDTRILLSVNDSILTIQWKTLQEKVGTINKMQFIDTLNNHIRKIIIEEIESPKNFQLITNKELEKNYGKYWKVNDRKFSGEIMISRVYTSVNRKYGIMKFDFYPDKFDGTGYFLLLERKTNSWTIKRIYRNWES